MTRPKGTTKNKGKKDSFDRFYTDVGEASRLFGLLLEALPGELAETATFIEPSAGDGAFVLAAECAGISPDRILALDICPADEPLCEAEIFEHDFLEGDFEERLAASGVSEAASADKTVRVFVGNPPFGEQCKTAIAFVNRALSLGRYCAFILPMSFHKETLQSKLSGRLTSTFPIHNDSYRVGDERISVPSAFFVFDAAQDFEPLPDFSDKLPFTRVPQSRKHEADFAIRRIGGTTGKARWDVADITYIDGHYFYVMDEGCPEDIVGIINSCEFPERYWSVGPRSLSSKEIAKNVYAKLVELGNIEAL